jgi:hypothetical protein
MAITYKVLGQSAPSATTPTDLYTVPGSTSAIASTLFVTNRGATATTFRVSVAVGGGATANKDYLYYDISIPSNDTLAVTAGITLATTDVVRVYAGNSNLSFTLFGSELT